jgi:hypothetical protein
MGGISAHGGSRRFADDGLQLAPPDSALTREIDDTVDDRRRNPSAPHLEIVTETGWRSICLAEANDRLGSNYDRIGHDRGACRRQIEAMHLTQKAFTLTALFLLCESLAHAETPPVESPASGEHSTAPSPMEDQDGRFRRTPAFEVNVLWPFFPGGIVDLKTLFPVMRTDQRDFRGELIVGLHSDFGWGPLTRPVEKYGKVSILATKIGYRQFLVHGTHLDVTVNVGWRREENNVYDGGRLDALIGRLWVFAGYQFDFSDKVYANVRGGGGLHLFRTDRFGDTERAFAPAGDANLGLRF